MAYDGSGTFAPLAAPTFPAVSGQPISSAYYNSMFLDIINNGLSQVLTRDGQGKPSAAINWNGQNLTGVAVFGATGAATFGSTVGITGTLTCTVGAAVGTSLTVGTTLTVSGAATIGTTLAVTGNITTNGPILQMTSASPVLRLEDTLGRGFGVQSAGNAFKVYDYVAGQYRWEIDSTGLMKALYGASVTGALSVSGAATIGTTLGVTGAATLASLSVTGAATVGTTLGVTGAATLGSLSVTGAAVITGNLTSAASGLVALLANSPFVTGGNISSGANPLAIGTTGANTLSFFTNGSSRATINSSGVFAIAGAATIGATLGVTGVSTLASLAVTGAATVGTTLNVTGASTLASLGVTAAATVGTTLSVTGASILTGSVGIGRTPTVGKLEIDHATDNRFYQYVAGTAIGIIQSTAAGINLASAGAYKLDLSTDGNVRASISSAGVFTYGGIEVGYRTIPRSTTVTTAVIGDVGKCIAASAGITIPNATFAAGDALSIYNDSAAAVTITQGASLTLRLGGSTGTGNRTLAARGMATIWFNTASEAIITGAGVS